MDKILICGPCVGEHSEQWIVDQAGAIHDAIDDLCVADPDFGTFGDSPGYDWLFKCSFDKANRTELTSYRGLGIDVTLRAFERIKALFGCEVTTDVHEVWQVHEVAPIVDVIQIPAMLSRQTDLITAAARVNKVVNIKVGTNMTDEQAWAAARKVEPGNVWLTYRGTAYGDNLVFDPEQLWRLGGQNTVIADVTHSTAKRGSVLVYSRVAAALDVEGLFIEAHPQPSKALSDGSMQLPIAKLRELLEGLQWTR